MIKKMLAQPDMGTRPAPIGEGNAPMAGKGFDISDLKQYLHVIVKRIWIVVLCFVLAIMVAAVMVFNREPTYTSKCTLQVTSGLPLPSQYNTPERFSKEVNYLAVQQSIIQQQTIISRAQERMGRTSDEVNRNIVQVRVSANSRVAQLYIEVESKDPIIASELANAMAEEFLEFKAEQRLDNSQSTVLSLTQQASRIREELQKEEEKLLAFERENITFSIYGERNTAAEFLARLNSKRSQYQMDRMLLEAQQPYLNDATDDVVLQMLSSPFGAIGGGFGTITGRTARASRGPEALIDRNVISGGSWQEIKRRRARLEAELAQLRTTFRDEHPKIMEVKQQIQEADQTLNVELKFVLQQYWSKLESLEIQENAVNLAIANWESEAIKVNRKYTDYEILRKNVRRLEQLYDAVTSRLKEIDISLGIEPETITILDRARADNEQTNKPGMELFLLAGLVGLGVGLGLVLALEYIDDSIRYPEEVRDLLQLPFFGVIPNANWDPEDLNAHMLSNIDQKSGLAEAYRNVRSALLFSGIIKPGCTIALTSSLPQEGKTTTTLNLCISLAQAGNNVLMVDADMRRGELHKFFQLEGGRGFSDILSGNAKPEALIQRTGVTNLDLIATGPFPTNPAELLLRDEFDAFVEFARRSYDVIVFDCPPVMAVSEAGIMASLADATLFVVWAGQTSRKISQLSIQQLKERGANVAGCVLNNLEFGRVGYYYYSTYYGYYDYEYRYEPEGER